jgi:hypothetical protein
LVVGVSTLLKFYSIKYSITTYSIALLG